MGVRALRAALAALLWLQGCASDGVAPAPETLILPDLSSQAPPDLLVFVTISGLRPEHYRGPAPWTPTLAAMSEEGVSADAVRSVTPASPRPTHATLVTGRAPAAHGIVAEQPLAALLAEGGKRRPSFDEATAFEAPTLWQVARASGLRVATLGWPTTVGAKVTANLPAREPTPGARWLEGLRGVADPRTLGLAREAGGDGDAAQRPGPERDALLVDVACGLLGGAEGAQLVLLHLSQTRVALASHGTGASEARRAFLRADQQIARLLSCTKAHGRLARAVFAVAGDHGFLPVHTVVSPNAVLAAAGLLTASSTGSSLLSWTAVARSNGGTAFVYAKASQDALLARRALSAEAERSGAFRVLSAEEMLGFGADPAAWFGLEAEPGFAFRDAAAPPVLRAAVERGAGGYLPDRSAMDTGFVAWGPGLARGLHVPSMHLTDIAPTLAPLLGLELTEADGRMLVGLLRLPRVSAFPDDALLRVERAP